MRQSRADLQLLKATPSTPKAQRKKGTAIIFCQQQRNIVQTKSFIKRKLPTHSLLER